MLHEVVDVPNLTDFEEQAMAEQHTQYDMLFLLGLAQNLLPQTSGLLAPNKGRLVRLV